MAIVIPMGIPPQDIAEGFDQEPDEMAAMLVHLSGIHADQEERADFLKHFGVAVLQADADVQTRVHALLAEMTMAIEGRF